MTYNSARLISDHDDDTYFGLRDIAFVEPVKAQELDGDHRPAVTAHIFTSFADPFALAGAQAVPGALRHADPGRASHRN